MRIYLQGLTMGLAYVAPIGLQNLFVINSALTQRRSRVYLTRPCPGCRRSSWAAAVSSSSGSALVFCGPGPPWRGGGTSTSPSGS